MLEHETYNWLGIRQACGIERSEIMEEVSDEFIRTRRHYHVLKTSKSGRNIVKAINPIAIPVFRVLAWKSKIDRRMDQRKGSEPL